VVAMPVTAMTSEPAMTRKRFILKEGVAGVAGVQK
jgi:hypothetical protein